MLEDISVPQVTEASFLMIAHASIVWLNAFMEYESFEVAARKPIAMLPIGLSGLVSYTPPLEMRQWRQCGLFWPSATLW